MQTFYYTWHETPLWYDYFRCSVTSKFSKVSRLWASNSKTHTIRDVYALGRGYVLVRGYVRGMDTSKTVALFCLGGSLVATRSPTHDSDLDQWKTIFFKFDEQSSTLSFFVGSNFLVCTTYL